MPNTKPKLYPARMTKAEMLSAIKWAKMCKKVAKNSREHQELNAIISRMETAIFWAEL